MKNIYKLSKEELLKVALDSDAVSSALSRKGDFDIQGCVKACLDNIGRYFRKCNGLPYYASLPKELSDELSVFLPQVEPLVWDRVHELRAERVRQHTVTAINFARASAIIGDALRAAGFQGSFDEQRYRAKVSVIIGAHLSAVFYVNYKDLAKEGKADSIVAALRDLRSVMDRLGTGLTIKRK